jgi:hypothetical protein
LAEAAYRTAMRVGHEPCMQGGWRTVQLTRRTQVVPADVAKPAVTAVDTSLDCDFVADFDARHALSDGDLEEIRPGGFSRAADELGNEAVGKLRQLTTVPALSWPRAIGSLRMNAPLRP